MNKLFPHPHALNVLLDIDETMIHSVVTPCSRVPRKPDPRYDSLVMSTGDGSKECYVVYGRPYLQEFLDYVFANFNVGILTYGTKDYAQPILDHFVTRPQNPERKLIYKMDRDYEHKTKNLVGKKNLSHLFKVLRPAGFYRWNTILVDNDEIVSLTNPSNVIKVPDFEPENKATLEESLNDHSLIGVIKILGLVHKRWSEKIQRAPHFYIPHAQGPLEIAFEH